MLRRLLIAGLILAPSIAFAGSMLLLRVGGAAGGGGGVASGLTTPIFGVVAALPAATSNSTVYSGPSPTAALGSNVYNTSNSVRRAPFPFKGTVANANCSLAVNDSTAVIIDYLNGAPGSVGCSGWSSSPALANSGSAADPVAAGTLFQWQFSNPVGSGGSWQGEVAHISFTYQADSGQHVALMGQTAASGTAAGPIYYPISSGLGSSTESSVAQIVCTGCSGTIHGLYAIPNATESSGAKHTYGLIKNGVTGTPLITCTPTANGTSDGCCVTDNPTPGFIGGTTTACGSTTAVTISDRDTLSFYAQCTTGTCSNSVLPGYGIDFTPTTSNVVPAFASTAGTGGGSAWTNLTDSALGTTQSNYSVAPVNMTVQSVTFCSFAQMTQGPGTGYSAVMQIGAAGIAPTTPSAGTAPAPQLNTTSPTTCTTALAANYTSVAVDSTHPLSVPKSQTVDYNIARNGTVISTPLRIGATITVP